MAVMFVMKGMVKAWGAKGAKERVPFVPSSNFNFSTCRHWHVSVMRLDCCFTRNLANTSHRSSQLVIQILASWATCCSQCDTPHCQCVGRDGEWRDPLMMCVVSLQFFTATPPMKLTITSRPSCSTPILSTSRINIEKIYPGGGLAIDASRTCEQGRGESCGSMKAAWEECLQGPAQGSGNNFIDRTG